MPRRPHRLIPSVRGGRRTIVALAVSGISVASACTSTSEPAVQTLPPATAAPSHGAGTLAAATPGTATITSFDLRPQLSCTGAIDVTVSTTYATTGADTVAFVIDGDQVPGAPPTSGRFELPLSCDDRSHTVVLVAVDDRGGTTVDSRVVLTTTTPLGN